MSERQKKQMEKFLHMDVDSSLRSYWLMLKKKKTVERHLYSEILQLPNRALEKLLKAWTLLSLFFRITKILGGLALSTFSHCRVGHWDSVLVHTPAMSLLPALLRLVGTVLITLGLERWQRDRDQTCSLLLALSQRCWGKTNVSV